MECQVEMQVKLHVKLKVKLKAKLKVKLKVIFLVETSTNLQEQKGHFQRHTESQI